MSFSDFNSHTNILFYNLGLLKVRDVIKFQQLKLVFEFCNNLLPIELENIFKYVSDVHNYDTISASKHLLFIPRIFTSTYGSKSIKFYCPSLWNLTIKNGISIDADNKNNVNIDSIHNARHFKRILKEHFLFQYLLDVQGN